MRSGPVKKEPKQPDPVFKSKLVAKVISAVMLDGKKSVAENIVYKSMDLLAEDKKQALDIFETGIRNVSPKVEVRSRRVGGATYQVPMPVRHDRAEALGIRWIVGASRKRKGKEMHQALAEELKNAFEGIGDAIKKRDDVHKMADANKAFSHFRFN